MNHYKEPKVSKIVDDHDGIMNDLIPRIRLEPTSMTKKDEEKKFTPSLSTTSRFQPYSDNPRLLHLDDNVKSG